MKYRLLALDMDGTLLDSSKRIRPRTLEALRACAGRGTMIALSSGRGPSELEDYRSQLRGIVRYGCLLSGGLVYDLDAEKIVEVEALSTDDALAVLAQGRDEGAMAHMLTPHESVVRTRDVDRMDEVGMGIYRPMFTSCCRMCDDLEGYVRTHEGLISKINLYHANTDSRMRSRRRLEGRPLTLTDSETTSLETTPAGVTKALGMGRLCDYVGVSLAECIAVGDAPNDTDVLRVAGLSVAMGNATPDIVELADVMVADNDHDGIVEVIERYLQ